MVTAMRKLPQFFHGLVNKNDLFLLTLLLVSLSLNLYLGVKLKSVPRVSAEPSTPKLNPGMTVQAITATNGLGKEERITYSDSPAPTVFYVFSPSCGWCERNTKNINAITSLRKNSFRFIGLALSDQGLAGYTDSHHLDFPIYKNVSPESIEMLGLASTPQTIVIGSDGKVLKNWVGAFTARVQPEIEQFFDVRLPGLTETKK
jgi:hypothetical protein